MSRTYGVVVGQVTDVEDPEGEGRARVHFPWLSEDNTGYWAPVATLMAGSERGSWFMPEVGDEVLVAFEHGDVRHPYIIGFLWNGSERPPNDNINTSVRRLRTVSGHVVEFNDNGGEENILIKTQGDRQILMDDANKHITIQTANGHEIKLDDAGGSVTVKTSGGRELNMDDAGLGAVALKTGSGAEVQLDGAADATIKTEAHEVTLSTSSVTIKAGPINTIEVGLGSISISAPMSALSVTCLMADVKASSMMSITAPMLNVTAPLMTFTGVAKFDAIVAQAISSSAYTPAPGNLIGL